MEKRKRKSEKLSAVQKRSHSRARAQTMAGSPDDFEEVG
jgi:hypothetical protein